MRLKKNKKPLERCLRGFSKEYLNVFKNDKYLFICLYDYRYYDYYCSNSPHLTKLIYVYAKYVYSLDKDEYLECIHKDFPNSYFPKVNYTPKCSEDVPIPKYSTFKILCNYNNDLFIAKSDHFDYEICQYNDNKFKCYKKLPFSNFSGDGIIKLKNNNFVIYSEDEIKLIKSIN